MAKSHSFSLNVYVYILREGQRDREGQRERQRETETERETERERERAGEGPREGERERIPDLFHSTSKEPNMGLDLTNLEIMT